MEVPHFIYSCKFTTPIIFLVSKIKITKDKVSVLSCMKCVQFVYQSCYVLFAYSFRWRVVENREVVDQSSPVVFAPYLLKSALYCILLIQNVIILVQQGNDTSVCVRRCCR